MVKFYLTNKQKSVIITKKNNVNFDYCMVTCRETAHIIERELMILSTRNNPSLTIYHGPWNDHHNNSIYQETDMLTLVPYTTYITTSIYLHVFIDVINVV